MARNNRGRYDLNTGKVHVKYQDKTYDTKTIKTGTKEIESGTNGWREGKITVDTTKTILIENGKEIGTVNILGTNCELKFN